MCGRFEIQASSEELLDLLGIDAEGTLLHSGGPVSQPDIRPTSEILLVTNARPRELQLGQWGFVASWSERPGKSAVRPFNARDDKLATTAWRAAAETQRCLIPATAFFEWRAVPGEKKKRPVRFSLRSRAPFCFAGLWSRFQGGLSCTIVTTTPSALVAEVHDRMPVMLPREVMSRWMAPGAVALDSLAPLLAPYPAELMIAEEWDPLAGPLAPARTSGQLKLF